MTPLADALALAERGWYILPLHSVDEHGGCTCGNPNCRTPGKHPRRETDESFVHETVITSWFERWPNAVNIGIALWPSGLVSIAPDCPEWAEEFEARGLRSAPRFQSGGGEGHFHSLYKRPDDLPEKRLCKSGEYDILSGGYIVAPPSLHKSGRRYEWLQSPNGDLPELPQWAADLLRNGDQTTSETDFEQVDPNEPPVRLSEAAMCWWRGEKHAESSDRSDTLYIIGILLAKAGATKQTIIDALSNRDSVLYFDDPKFANRRDGGYKEYARIATKVLAEKGAPPTGEAKGNVKISDLLNGDLKPPQYVVKKLINTGEVSMVYAKQGEGKSTLVVALACHILTGRDFAGQPVKQGPVLWLGAEDINGVRSRFSGWCRGEEAEQDELTDIGLKLIEVRNLTLEAEREAILTAVKAQEEKQGEPFRLVVLDTLAASISGGNENDAGDIGLVMSFLEELAKSGSHALFVHHADKAQKNFRGSSRLADVSTILKANANNSKLTKDSFPKLTVTMIKQRNGPLQKPLSFELRSVDAGIDEDGDKLTLPFIRYKPKPPSVTLSEASQVVLRILREVGGDELTRKEIRKRLVEGPGIEMSETGLRNAINPLVDMQLVSEEKRGNVIYHRWRGSAEDPGGDERLCR